MLPNRVRCIFQNLHLPIGLPLKDESPLVGCVAGLNVLYCEDEADYEDVSNYSCFLPIDDFESTLVDESSDLPCLPNVEHWEVYSWVGWGNYLGEEHPGITPLLRF